jgi:hypothetical protein
VVLDTSGICSDSHKCLCVCVGGGVTFRSMKRINICSQRGSSAPRGLVANCTILRNSNGATDALNDMCVHPGRLSVPRRLNQENRDAAIRTLLLTELQTCQVRKCEAADPL